MGLKYQTNDLMIADNMQAQHICIDDLIDLLVIKDDTKYRVKVLSLPNYTPSVSCEMIDYEEYKRLLNL